MHNPFEFSKHWPHHLKRFSHILKHFVPIRIRDDHWHTHLLRSRDRLMQFFPFTKHIPLWSSISREWSSILNLHSFHTIDESILQKFILNSKKKNSEDGGKNRLEEIHQNPFHCELKNSNNNTHHIYNLISVVSIQRTKKIYVWCLVLCASPLTLFILSYSYFHFS